MDGLLLEGVEGLAAEVVLLGGVGPLEDVDFGPDFSAGEGLLVEVGCEHLVFVFVDVFVGGLVGGGVEQRDPQVHDFVAEGVGGRGASAHEPAQGSFDHNQK